MSSSIADLIVERAAKGAQPEWVAEVLEQLVWLMDDNGAEVTSAVERWLQGDDERKVRIALAIEGVFPFRNREHDRSIAASIGQVAGSSCTLRSTRSATEGGH
jgi:hypothetical protein